MIENYTPHALNIYQGDTVVATIPSVGLARVVMAPPEDTGHVVITENGTSVPIFRTRATGVVTGLPAPRPGVWLAVSKMTTDAEPDRGDLLIPDDLVRNEKGVPIGCRSFAQPIY